MTKNHNGYARVGLAEAFQMEKKARRIQLTNGWEFDLMPWRGHELITISDKVVAIFVEISKTREGAETPLDQLTFAQQAFKNHSGIVFEIVLETLRAPGVTVINHKEKQIVDMEAAEVADMKLHLDPPDILKILRAVWEVSIRPLLEELGLVPKEEAEEKTKKKGKGKPKPRKPSAVARRS